MFAGRGARGYDRATSLPTPAVADTLLAAAWLVFALDSLWQARRARAARAALGPVVVRPWRASALAGAALVVATLAGAAALEALAGRFAFRAGLALAGLVLAAAGVALHAWARRALGPLWSGPIEVRARHRVVARGPYAHVRHPIYLAVLLLAAGTVLAHPSPATACLAWGLAVGLALKIRLEERTLRATLGADYERYAARVPALLPRLARRAGRD